MGCGAVKLPKNPYEVEQEQIWAQALASANTVKRNTNVVVKRSGWKTIRIFVSSTFRDFHQEREILVKKVFPDLRAWCESRRLYLVECDLRWGVPKDSSTEATMRACLGEIDRCYQENKMPFFVNMTSERVGWVPTGEEIPEALREEYKWIEGLSVTEMEIMHGAYRCDNPNALFLMRDPKFLDTVPENLRTSFIDENKIAPAKLSILKKMIADKFPRDRVIKYNVYVEESDSATNTVKLGGFEGFSKAVFSFFKQRIEKQYPLDNRRHNPFLHMTEQHEAFMKQRCDTVVGRTEIFETMEKYLVYGSPNNSPLLVIGGAGSGKSSIMAKMADQALAKAHLIAGGGVKGWTVFYHFVGAVPGSTELLTLLRRMLHAIGTFTEKSLPSDLESAVQLTCSTLSNPKTRPSIIIIDALNQLDEETAAQVVSWMPKKLAPQVRCVFSMINDTPQHKALVAKDEDILVVPVTPLSVDDRKAIVNEMLGKYNKHLDESQMESLLSKKSSENPLWLSIACEELRVFGSFRQISDKINSLADGLLELEMQILTRFEEENGGQLLVAALCLLETSARGLLETELLVILGDEEHLMPGTKEKGEEFEKDHGREKKREFVQLPAFKWAEVYRALRPFLRPFGESGEGRLDFYHRSLSKAVRRKYFTLSNGEQDDAALRWWHKKLAKYFDIQCVNFQRKLEEYPIHLMAAMGDKHQKLEEFLSQWNVIMSLFDDDYSYTLLNYWVKGSSLERMEVCYMEMLNNFANTTTTKTEELQTRYEIISKLFVQGGRYKKATELCDKAIDLERTKFGSRPEKMVELLMLSAIVQDETMKLIEYMYASQLPQIKTIIETFSESIALREQLASNEAKPRLARCLNRLAFYYSGYAMRGGDDYLSKQQASEKAVETVERAISIYKELNDDIHVADALITKGVCYGEACEEQVKAYLEAEEIILRAVGRLHPAADRLYLNLGIYYEEAANIDKAFDYFRLWYEVCCDLYGRGHPKTKRCVSTLNESQYKRKSAERNIPVPTEN